MPFALLDDKFHSNAKVYAAGNAGAGLYARALSYCADHLTDGFVPAAWIKTISTPALLKKLETVTLFVKVSATESITTPTKNGQSTVVVAPANGYWIRDYLVHNPSRAEVETKRKTKAEAGRKGADARWHTDSTSMAPANELLNGSHSVGNAPIPGSQVPIDTPPTPTLVVDVTDEEERARVLSGEGVLNTL